jgi:ABC-type transport system involved in multi-copper enzyme maturation permease subunit
VTNILIFARLTVLEASRRKVLWALVGMAALIIGLSFWGFARLPAVHAFGTRLGGADSHLATAQLLGFVLFALSFVGALGMSFVAAPTIGGELESGVALSLLARPVRRSEILLGKWLGLVSLAVVYVALVGGGEIAAAETGTGYHVPNPETAVALLAAQAVVLLSLVLLLSTLLSPMAAGVVAVGLFGTAWVAGLVGDIGQSLHDHSVAEVGTVDHLLLPTDGLWNGVMNAIDQTSLVTSFSDRLIGNPFFQSSGLTVTYLFWSAAWLAAVVAATYLRFSRIEL